MLSSVSLLDFSPTGGSRVLSRLIGERLANDQTEVDMSFPGFEGKEYSEGQAVIAAMPVFGGRLPAVAAERLNRCRGNGAFAVAIVTYGNRDYEDALLELCDILAERGFRVVAAAALVAPHSLAPEFGKGRPDESDLAAFDRFTADILKKLAAGDPSTPSGTKGNRPYKTWSSGGIIPVVNGDCIDCGECAASCPVSAIPMDDYTVTDSATCILCARCIHICPSRARNLAPEYAEKVKGMLAKAASSRREPEFFL